MKSEAPRECWRTQACTVLIGLLVWSGCGQPQDKSTTGTTVAAAPAERGEVVATYKGREITSTDLLKELERLPAPSRVYLTQPERRKQFVENMIMNDLLFQEGEKGGIENDPEIERQVTDLRKRLVVQRVMRQYQTPPTITDEEVQKYYDANPNLYSTTQVAASHILVKDEETAKQIYAELQQHPDRFAALATEKSTDTGSAKKGGELGLFGQGRMVPEFDRAAFALQPGQISEPVKTRYGYHIIKVTERKEGERKPFEQVKEQIRTTLRNQRLQEQVDGHFADLKKGADVKIDEAALARVQIPTGPAPGAPGMPPIGSPTGH
jgi:peptidyl-prolyl cis-trans isomerase C